MALCLQTESYSSLPNYLQKTDLLNSPAFHIINVLFASIKCDFITIFFQTTCLQSRKGSSFSFLPIMTILRDVPDRGRLLFSTILIRIFNLPLENVPSVRKGHHCEQSPYSNTRTLCQFSQTILVFSKKVVLLNVP